MSEKWTGVDGYPCSFAESSVGVALTKAISALPGSDVFDHTALEQKAQFLWRQAESARENARSCNLPASQSATERDLLKLHDLCGKLVDHIEAMHDPAISALANEGFLAIPMAARLREIREVAREAFNECEGKEVRGRRPEIEAPHVSEIAGEIYQHITGRRPTFTSDPVTSEISGIWPDFLRSVFIALHIEASVASQARAASEKMRPGNHP
jgi:hypothetical protein